ncbi:MAG: hypothetical protein NC089_06340 [Bacteroides sp.]|nr:hypothetical protein [Bacteroides sp.]MCM1550720.1 hypothetical protein [Clostridium sp.]
MRKKLKRMSVFILTMSLLLTGCSKGGDAKGNSSDDSGTETDSQAMQGSETGNGDKTQPLADISEFSGDWEAAEEYGYPPFWLKYADFESVEEKDVSDVMLCDTFLIGTALTDILAAYSSFEFFYYDEEDIIIDTNQLEDILDNSDIMIKMDALFRITAYPDEERTQEREIAIEVYNHTGSEASIGACIQDNQFEIYFDGDEVEYINGILGVDFDSKDFRTGIEEVLEIIGRPDRVYSNFYSNDGTDREGTCVEIEDILDQDEPNINAAVHEEFLNVLQKGGGTLSYDLVYEREGVVFVINVNEYCYDVEGYDRISYRGHSRMEYWSTWELYEEMNDEYPENLLYDLT